jgi:benzil reductase ((S)-benzoin forming)
MKYYLLTGASRGLGRALAEVLLEAPDTTVLGIARQPATLTHPRYEHHQIDLADATALENALPSLLRPYEDATSLTLINNAAVLGDIGYFGQLPNDHFTWVFDVNVLAPARLMDAFLAAYTPRAIPLTILNISSGAAQRPIDGWAAYCASKAALEMLTRTAAAEQALLGHTHVRLHTLSPGVVDTPMQAQIRAAEVRDFSQVEHFRALHTRGELAGAAEVAQRIAAFLCRPVPWPEVVVSLRELA